MKEFIEKLISRLEEFRNDKYMNGVDRFTTREKRVFDIAEEIVNQLAGEYNNGWILCSDRLPDFLDNVLVCTKSGGRTIAHLKHTPIEWIDMHMNKIDDVIAWKYLDAPYQPKGE